MRAKPLWHVNGGVTYQLPKNDLWVRTAKTIDYDLLEKMPQTLVLRQGIEIDRDGRLMMEFRESSRTVAAYQDGKSWLMQLWFSRVEDLWTLCMEDPRSGEVIDAHKLRHFEVAIDLFMGAIGLRSHNPFDLNPFKDLKDSDGRVDRGLLRKALGKEDPAEVYGGRYGTFS